jgi:DNA-binding NtrC family response regulator
MTMPGMTGAELAVDLLRIRAGLPVILCTGYSDRITEEEAARIGVRALMMKPLVLPDLAETVRRVLEGR